jgi:aldehyde dehydrogenase (NAD+)
MRVYDQFYINGEWVAPLTPNNFDVINPADESVCATISLGAAGDVDKAVAAARDAFNRFGFSTREERIAILEAVLVAYQNNHQEMADAISEEMGAPSKLAANVQANLGIWHISTALEILKTYEFESQLGKSRILKEPIGVCGLITPWNWPVNQIACKVAPALAVGCTMVLKPSEVAPLSAYVFAKIMDEAGVPAGVFNLVNGDGAGVGSLLSAHPGVDMMSFTGSTRAGSLVAQAAAPTVKRVAQELGGKSANILLNDVDFEAAVTRGAMSMFVNSGQSCNAPSRMLVPAERMDEAANIAAAAAATVVVGDPKADSTTMGPVVSELQFNKIQGLIQAGIDEGARLVAGGTGLPEGLDKGFYVKPTIFADVNNDMTVAREEIFGPVLVILPYDSEEQAIDIANDTPFGLAGYIQGNDMERVRAVASKIRAGNININGQSGDMNTPFGGYKQSGNGREWGEHGFADYLEVKAVSGLG